MLKLIKTIFSKIKNIKDNWVYKRRMKALRKRDPFIYK